ncbi:MAG: type II toxin-antitoxin system PemK/MazF family toxin, partial [Planctomycetota bacterium]
MRISRGEIWLVNLDPTIGAEIHKTRPVVVVSSDAIGALPIRLVVPITEWKEYFASNVWHVRLDAD